MESLANKYRPQVFSDVVGQENTVKILSNQIETGQIKHGYLFSGGAGTGKTTCARIFARQINTKHVETHPHLGVMAAIPQGEIIEIDAASNNGVDNVREIRENSRFKPITGGFKVYVIDECHMLSTGAWNALLKVLEEPPEHVVFLLCTTDPQKIPATILSRVQRFQFKRMTQEQLEHRLNHIILLEGLYVDANASEYIAKLANGGMRDAISILDTCVSYKPKETLTIHDVYSIVGVTDYKMYFTLVTDLLNKDAETVIYAIEDMHSEGKDLKQFVKSFMDFILDIEKYDITGTMDYVSIPSMFEENINRLISYELFDKWFERLTKLSEWIKYDPNPKSMVEGCFVALCR